MQWSLYSNRYLISLTVLQLVSGFLSQLEEPHKCHGAAVAADTKKIKVRDTFIVSERETDYPEVQPAPFNKYPSNLSNVATQSFSMLQSLTSIPLAGSGICESLTASPEVRSRVSELVFQADLIWAGHASRRRQGGDDKVQKNQHQLSQNRLKCIGSLNSGRFLMHLFSLPFNPIQIC